MELYIVTRTFVYLDDGYYDEKTKNVFYRRKEERFGVINKAFISYIKAAKYIRELIEEEHNKYGKVFEEDDMRKWDVFFIGFHHECTLHYKSNPIAAAFCKNKNVPAPERIVKYKIEICSADFEVLDEKEEILKGTYPKISEFSVVGDYDFTGHAQNIKEFENKLGITHTHICLPWEENK